MHQDFKRNEIKKILNDFGILNENLIDQLIEKFHEMFDSRLTQIKDNYEIIMENANDFIAIIDEQFQFRRINENIHYEKLGYKSKDLLGKSVLKFIHPDDLDRVRGIIKEGFSEGKGSAKFRFKSSEGNWLWLEAKGKTFTDSQKNPKALIISRDISKQVKIESELKQSEVKYRTLIKNQFDVFMKTDLTGNILYVSPQIESDFGYLREDIIGKNIFDYIHPEDLQRVLPEFKKLTKGTTSSLEYRAKKKDGSYVWVISRGRMIEEGDQRYLLGSMRNIDEQRRMNKRLKESEKRYRELFEGARDGFVMVNKNGQIIDANQAYCKMLGYSLEELKTFEDFYQITPEKWHEWEEKEIWEEKLLKEGHSGIYEKEYIRKNGEIFPVELQSYALFGDAQEIKYLWGVVRDITERKAAEEKVIKSERKYRLLAENVSDIIWVMDMNFSFTYLSPSVEELRGYTVEEVMNQSLSELFTAESFKTVQKVIKEKLTPQKLKDPKYEGRTTLELEHTCKDGSTVWVEIKMVVLRNSSGKPIGILGVSRDITKRRKIEAKLEQSQEKLRRKNEEQQILLDNINTQIWYLTDPRTYGAVNKAHAEFYGVEKGDLAFKDLYEMFPEDVAKVCEEGNIEVFRTKKQIRTEEWVPHKSGKRRLNSINKTPKLDEKGNVEYVVCTAEDITEKREYEKRLKESQKRLRLFIDTSPDMFFLKDRTFKYILVNKANAEFFNSKEEDIIGKTDFDFLPKDAAEYCRKTDEEAIEQKKTIKNIEIIDDKVYESRKMPAIIDGEVKGVAGIIRDITEQERMERKLLESQEKYHDIAEMLPDIIYETNRKMNLTYLNSLGFEKLALDQEKLKEGVNLLDLVADEDKRKLQNKMKKILMGKSIDPIECLIYEKNKEDKFYARIHSVPIYKNGIIVGIRGTISDINNMVLAKKKIKESEEELKRLNNLKSELLRRTSHELKTPLVSIKGFSSLLLDQFKDALNENAVSMIEEIQAGCKRLENLIKDILDSAKLQSGKAKVKKAECKLSELVQETLKSLKGIITTRKQSINLDLDEDLSVYVEKERFIEVLENVISNALKYTPPGGEITIKSRNEKERILISVKDTGIGFTPEEKVQLFTQFGKIERYGEGYDLSIDGSGLGLYIAKKNIELHGGDIWVESAGRNMGSTFYISLPPPESK